MAMRDARRRSPLRAGLGILSDNAPDGSPEGDDTSALYATWQREMAVLERATQEVLRGDEAGIARGQQAIARLTPTLRAIAEATGNRPDAGLSQRWRQALEAFNAASADYDPDAAPQKYGPFGPGQNAGEVATQGAQGPSSITSDGVRIGNTIVKWPLVAAIALGLWLVVTGRAGRALSRWE